MQPRRARDPVPPGFGRLWAASVAVPLLALTAACWWSWGSVTAQQTIQLRRGLGMVHEQALRAMETQEAVLSATNAFVAGMSWPEIRSSPAVYQFTRQLDEAATTVVSLGLVDPDGHIAVASETPNPPQGLSLADRDYVRVFPPGTKRRDTVVGEVIASRVTGAVQVHLAQARLAASGVADGGVIASAFTPAYFERFFKTVAESPQTGFMLARTDGLVLASYPQPQTAPATRLAPDDPVLAALRATEPPNAARIIRSGSLLSGLQLTGFRPVGDYPLVVINRIDPHLVRDLWLDQIAVPALGALAAMLLLLSLTARAQRRTGLYRSALLSRTTSAEADRALAQERAELEARLRQSEKVAALGQLAAGVAHDFNNLLQTILLHGDLLEQRPDNPTPVRDSAAVIVKACLRGKELAQRMLDHARREDGPGGTIAGGTIDPEAALRGAQQLLERSLGRRHRLHLAVVAGELPPVRGNAAELESVIMNLVINARDAMPDGGSISIAADAVRFRDGRALRIAVGDTGHGMDEATLARAGEAFFTTKERGRGTGLGLSMARGFAERAGGRLTLESAPDRGTTATLLLPAA